MAQIENLDKLLKKLEKLDNIDLDEVLNKACILVENDAKKKCPVDKGQLRNSITHEVEGTEDVVGTNTEYAPYVEIGTGIFSSEGTGRQDKWSYQDAEGHWHSTVGQKPQPFLNPALDENRKEIIQLFREELKKGVQNL